MSIIRDLFELSRRKKRGEQILDRSSHDKTVYSHGKKEQDKSRRHDDKPNIFIIKEDPDDE